MSAYGPLVPWGDTCPTLLQVGTCDWSYIGFSTTRIQTHENGKRPRFQRMVQPKGHLVYKELSIIQLVWCPNCQFWRSVILTLVAWSLSIQKQSLFNSFYIRRWKIWKQNVASCDDPFRFVATTKYVLKRCVIEILHLLFFRYVKSARMCARSPIRQIPSKVLRRKQPGSDRDLYQRKKMLKTASWNGERKRPHGVLPT